MKRYRFCALGLSLLMLSGCGVGNTAAAPAPEKKEETQVEKPSKPWPGANEAGQLPIIMYHRIKPETGDYDRSPEHFYSDLERLYAAGYRPVSVTDYLSGSLDVPGGMTPMVITFDDGDITQYRTVGDSLEPTPDCAVGIMERFRKTHPDFNPQAVFFLNGVNPFGEPEKLKGKLEYLIAKGYVIGNHSFAHENFSKLTAEQVSETLGKNVQWFDALKLKGHMETLALPFGVRPKDPAAKEAVKAGSWNGTTYTNKGVFNVGWCPENPPWHTDFNPASIKRIRCGDDADELVYWLDWLDKHPEKRYRSDGLADAVTVPAGLEDQVKPGSMKVIVVQTKP